MTIDSILAVFIVLAFLSVFVFMVIYGNNQAYRRNPPRRSDYELEINLPGLPKFGVDLV